jgi:hypothetical protein
MKNKKMILGIAIIMVIGFTMTACLGGGGKSLNSPEALKEYLDKQPANSPDKPIKVSMTINDPMLRSVVVVLMSAGKYVSLNLTGNALTNMGDNGAFYNCKTLVGITIPESVTYINPEVFKNCDNLINVTFKGKISEDKLYRGSFDGDLREKYLKGGPGTYTTTNPGWRAEWTKQ